MVFNQNPIENHKKLFSFSSHQNHLKNHQQFLEWLYGDFTLINSKFMKIDEI